MRLLQKDAVKPTITLNRHRLYKYRNQQFLSNQHLAIIGKRN